MAACTIASPCVKRLLIGATLLSHPGRRQVLSYSCRNIWLAAINTKRYPALASSFWKPAVAPVFSPGRLSSSSCFQLKMVNSVDIAPEQNGCENNGHSAAQEVLVDTPSFKEVKIPLAWGHLAGMYLLISLFNFPALSCFLHWLFMIDE